MQKSLRAFLTVALLLITCLKTLAQDRYTGPLVSGELSIGLKAGISDLWGDLGTKGRSSHYFNGLYFQNTKCMAGVFVHYSLTPWLSVRVEGTAGTIYATDAWNIKDANKAGQGSTAYLLYQRNLDVKSNILEALLNLEISPLKLLAHSKLSHWPLQPFLAGGIGIFHFNPKTSYTSPNGSMDWVETRPLHLEGEGLDRPNSPAGYKLTQVCFPIGAGVRYNLNSRVSVGIEYLLRVTSTDYLDGVSNNYVNPGLFSSFLSESDARIAAQVYDKSYQIDPSIKHSTGDVRGNPKNNDAYSTLGFELMWRLPSRRDRF